MLDSAVFVDVGLKLIVNRRRPPAPLVDKALTSFPGGHVSHVIVLFGLVPFLLWALTGRKAYLLAGFVLFAVVVRAVAVIRVGLGARWPSDVIVGLLIGVSLLLGAEENSDFKVGV